MEENSSSVEVLGKKNQIGTHRFKNPLSVEKKKSMNKGPTCLQLSHTASTYYFSFMPKWVQKG